MSTIWIVLLSEAAVVFAVASAAVVWIRNQRPGRTQQTQRR